MRRLVRVVCVLAPLVFASSACASSRQVAPDGKDSGDCRSSPCASLAYAYSKADPDEVIEVLAGSYGPQVLPKGTKAVTFRGDGRAKLQKLDNSASHVSFVGLDVDAGFANQVAFENHDASDVLFKDSRIGNVTDNKGALISGARLTFDNVTFHDAVVKGPDIHMECVFAIGVPGLVVRNSTFHDCGIMDLFFTYGAWWTPKPPAYGDVTLENNVFAHPENEGDRWHYYGLFIADTGDPTLRGWVVRHNTFETAVNVAAKAADASRWEGNIGGWDCVPGMTYARNVGQRCSSSDRSVRPNASTPTRAAPFGWRDPAKLDFHLQRGSRAINAGATEDAPAADRDGQERDDKPDAGAYEYAAGSGATRSPEPWRIRKAALSHAVICRTARGHCRARTSLRVDLGRRGRVTVSVRSASNARADAEIAPKGDARRRTVRLRGTALRRGRYSVIVRATDSQGVPARSVRLRLRVR